MKHIYFLQNNGICKNRGFFAHTEYEKGYPYCLNLYVIDPNFDYAYYTIHFIQPAPG